MFGWISRMFGSSRPGPAPGSAGFAKKLLAQWAEAYKLARRDRPREHFQPQHFSGTSAALSSSDMMTRRVRDLARNTAQAKRISQMLTDLIVGTGIQTFSWPFSPAELFEIVTEIDNISELGELGPRLSFALESDDLYEQWSSDPDQFDAEGRLNRAEMERLVLSEAIQVGNGLIVRSRPTKYKFVPLQFQLVEAEQIDMSLDREARNGQNKIVAGREYDSNNRVVAYHILVNHPYDVSFSGLNYKSQRVLSSRVIDLALFGRPSASVGVSWLDAIGQSVYDRDAYMDSEIRTAALCAVFALVHKMKDPYPDPLGFDDEEPDDANNPSVKLGHSPIASTIGIDEDISLVNSQRPNPKAESFIGLIDRDIAAGTGLSYYSLTGNYAATSFSSTRAAKLDEDLHVLPLQQWFATHVSLPIRKQFNAMAAASGLFDSVTAADFVGRERTYQRFDALGNGRDILDPAGEVTAKINKLRTGLSTLKEECARQGKHWIRILMQRAIERRVAELFGVPLDYSLGGGGPSLSSLVGGSPEVVAEPVEEGVDENA